MSFCELGKLPTSLDTVAPSPAPRCLLYIDLHGCAGGPSACPAFDPPSASLLQERKGDELWSWARKHISSTSVIMPHAIPYGGCAFCTQILQPLMTLPCTLHGLCPNACQLPGGPAGGGAWCSNLSSCQCQDKVPGSDSGALSYYLLPGQCWAKCQWLGGPRG